MPDERDITDDDIFIRAGEYMLGVLEGQELATAQRDYLFDAAFASAAEWWAMRFGAMSEAAAPLVPSPTVWLGVERQISGLEPEPSYDLEASRKGPAGWSLAMAATGLAAAAAAFLLFLQTPTPSPIVPSPAQPAEIGPQLVVQLRSEDGERGLAGVVQTARGRIALTSTNLRAEDGKVPVLWVIPEGGAPVSLGAIVPEGEFDRDLSPEERSLLKAGATLAVTFEDDIRTRHDAPTMPIIVAGAMEEV